MLEKEYQFFQENRDSLIAKYSGRFIVIVGNKVIGDYDSFEEAFYKSQEGNEPGSFLIQECSNNEPAQVFHSRVCF